MPRHVKPEAKLTGKQRAAALLRVGKISYKAAPSILHLRIVSSILDSVLPIATTFFAAQTTTELTRAYNGEAGAGQAAITYVILTAVMGVITIGWSTLEGYISRMARYKLEAAVNDQLISQFLSLDYWRYDDKDTADLLDKSRQFSNFFVYMFDTLGSILTSFIGLVTSIVALLFVSPWLSLLLIAAVIPGLFIQYRLSKARTEHWSQNIESRRSLNFVSWQLTDIKSIAEIRLYGLARHLLDLRQTYRDTDEKEQIMLERRFIGKELLASVIESVAEVIALLYVVLQIIAHALPVGQFLFVQQVVSRGLSGMRSVTTQFMRIDEDLANLSAYDEFMTMPIQSRGEIKLLASPKSIEFQDVSFSYPHNDQRVLDHVSLSVTQGQHIAIVGENGAGKSTLINLLLGFYMPTKGKVLIDGNSTQQLDIEQWHGYVGVLQQASNSYDYAVAKDNVLLGDVSRPVSKKRYENAINDAEAKEFLDKLPKKDKTYINQWMEDADGTPGVALSGGQMQRLSLARNFYRDSPVVILDEPTSAIDALAESRIFKKLFALKGKTIITISHRLSTVRRADVIFVLEEGRVVEKGTHDQLVANKGAYYTLFESQL